jgi:hypothetical protein
MLAAGFGALGALIALGILARSDGLARSSAPAAHAAAALAAIASGCGAARSALSGHGWWPLVRIGSRNASFRPSRSILSIAVVSFAFILIAVDVFRRDGRADAADRQSGTGIRAPRQHGAAGCPGSQQHRRSRGLRDAR